MNWSFKIIMINIINIFWCYFSWFLLWSILLGKTLIFLLELVPLFCAFMCKNQFRSFIYWHRVGHSSKTKYVINVSMIIMINIIMNEGNEFVSAVGVYCSKLKYLDVSFTSVSNQVKLFTYISRGIYCPFWSFWDRSGAGASLHP